VLRTAKVRLIKSAFALQIYYFDRLCSNAVGVRHTAYLLTGFFTTHNTGLAIGLCLRCNRCRGIMKIIKRYFVTGLIIVLPLYISFYVFVTIVNFMDSLMYLLPEVARPDTYLPFHVPGIGLLVTIIGIFLVGMLTTNFLGRKLVTLGEWFLDWIPLLRTIYKSSKQFISTFFSKDADGFRKVVLIEFPRKGTYAVAFVTSKTQGEVQAKVEVDLINVFLPTTPNPTSGFYLAVPSSEVISLDMTVEDAFKVIMSGGVIVPDGRGRLKK